MPYIEKIQVKNMDFDYDSLFTKRKECVIVDKIKCD